MFELRFFAPNCESRPDCFFAQSHIKKREKFHRTLAIVMTRSVMILFKTLDSSFQLSSAIDRLLVTYILMLIKILLVRRFLVSDKMTERLFFGKNALLREKKETV